MLRLALNREKRVCHCGNEPDSWDDIDVTRLFKCHLDFIHSITCTKTQNKKIFQRPGDDHPVSPFWELQHDTIHLVPLQHDRHAVTCPTITNCCSNSLHFQTAINLIQLKIKCWKMQTCKRKHASFLFQYAWRLVVIMHACGNTSGWQYIPQNADEQAAK